MPSFDGGLRAFVALGCILDEQLTDPLLEELVVTSDGCVLAQAAGDVGSNELIGEEADLEPEPAEPAAVSNSAQSPQPAT